MSYFDTNYKIIMALLKTKTLFSTYHKTVRFLFLTLLINIIPARYKQSKTLFVTKNVDVFIV